MTARRDGQRKLMSINLQIGFITAVYLAVYAFVFSLPYTVDIYLRRKR